MLKYSDESNLTENPFMDILVHNLKVIAFSCVIKDEETADNNETVDTLKDAGTFIACVEKHAELGLFRKIPRKFLEEVNVPYFDILRYEKDHDWMKIPDEFHKPLVELLTPWYISNITDPSVKYEEGMYEEKNNYYRMLIGQPPIGEFGPAIEEFEYLIPDYIVYDKNLRFFHELGTQTNQALERAGVLDVVRATYPDHKYLEYLTKDIDLYKARIALDFQILWTTDEMNPYITEEFRNRYAESRKFMLATVYSKAFELESTYYHSFMMAYTILITLLDMICEVQVHIIRKDVLDRRCVSYIFSMYNIPYYRIIPFKYQERLCKRVHDLVKYKSCDRGFLNIINLFGFENITVYKYYLLKNRKINSWGEFIFSDKLGWVAEENSVIKHIRIDENLIDEDNGVVVLFDTEEKLEDESYYYKTAETIDKSQVLSTYNNNELQAYFPEIEIDMADYSRQEWAQSAQSLLDLRKDRKAAKDEYLILSAEFDSLESLSDQASLDAATLQTALYSDITVAKGIYFDLRDDYKESVKIYNEAVQYTIDMHDSGKDLILNYTIEETELAYQDYDSSVQILNAYDTSTSYANLKIAESNWTVAVHDLETLKSYSLQLATTAYNAQTTSKKAYTTFEALFGEETDDNELLQTRKQALDDATKFANAALSTYNSIQDKLSEAIANAVKATRAKTDEIQRLYINGLIQQGYTEKQAITQSKKYIASMQSETMLVNLQHSLGSDTAKAVLTTTLYNAKNQLFDILTENNIKKDNIYIQNIVKMNRDVKKAKADYEKADTDLKTAQQEYDTTRAAAIDSSTALSLASDGLQAALDAENKAIMDSNATTGQVNTAQTNVTNMKLAFDSATTINAAYMKEYELALQDKKEKEKIYTLASNKLDKYYNELGTDTAMMKSILSENTRYQIDSDTGYDWQMTLGLILEAEKNEAEAKKTMDDLKKDRDKAKTNFDKAKEKYNDQVPKAKKKAQEALKKAKAADKKARKQKKVMDDLDIEILETKMRIEVLNTNSKYYRYIPFPIPFFLQKGNVLIIRLDDKILTEGVDYEIIYYNTLKWLNLDLLNDKSKLIYEFYYDETTSGEFDVNLEDSIKLVQDFVTQDAIDQRDFSFDGTKLEEYLYSSSLKMCITNTKSIRKSTDFIINADEKLAQFRSSYAPMRIIDDEPHEYYSFIDIQPSQFNALYQYAEVTVTTADITNGYVTIPEPFPKYCLNGNTFILRRWGDIDFIDSDDYTITATATYARLQFKNPSMLVANRILYFYFIYSDMAVVNTVNLKRKYIEVTQSSAYQYEYNLPDGFPVNHFVESGYQVYMNIIGSWIPATWYTIIGNRTIVITNHSISPEHLQRKMKLCLFYLDYDRTIYRNLKVGSAYVVAEYDFQKRFTLPLPFDNFVSLGGKYVIDQEGILLTAFPEFHYDDGTAKGQDYVLESQTTNSITITIPNRDIRPMKGNRINITYYYQDKDDDRYKLVTTTAHAEDWTYPKFTVDSNNNVSKSFVKFNSDKFTSKDQQIFIKFPFYPYLETGQSFLMFIGYRRIDPDRLELVPGTLSSFKIKDVTDEEFEKFLKDKTIQFIFFYNPYYIDHGTEKFIVEWKEQNILQDYIEMDTPAKNYIENGWPYFVSYRDSEIDSHPMYISEENYDVMAHTFYTNPVSDLFGDKIYGNSIWFTYIYKKKPGYLEYKEIEDYEATTTLHFSPADVKDLYQVQYMKDKANWKGYDVITTADPWWDGEHYIPDAHNTIKNNIYKHKFNYERTKYYQVTVITDLGEYAAQISYFYSILYDDVALENNVDIKIPSIAPDHRIKLSHLFIYLTTLTFIFNGYEDFIIDRPSKWMWVLGFNFKTDLNTIKEFLRLKHRHNSDYRIWDWIRPTTQIEDIVKFVNIYKTNYHVRSVILKGMVDANDYKEYSIWKKIYDSLLIWKLNMSYFKLKDGSNASTYTEFLKSWDPILYESIVKLKAITDQETLQDEIIRITDDVIYILSEYIDGPECSEIFKRFAGNDPMQAAKYINILIDFFKSYKIMLLDRTEEMNVNDPNDPDNYFRPIDNIDTLLEQTINKDYFMPDEKISTTEHMELHEWIAVPDKTRQLITFPYPTHNASHPRDIVEVKPALIQPYHSDLPEVTHIVNTGLWMKEDITIEPYRKDSIVKYINPCKVQVNKLWFNLDLPVVQGGMEYIKQQAVAFIETTVNLPKRDFYAWFESKVRINKLPFVMDLTGTCMLKGILLRPGTTIPEMFDPLDENIDQIPQEYNENINDRIKRIAEGWWDDENKIYHPGSNSIAKFFVGMTRLREVSKYIVFSDEEDVLYFNDFRELCDGCKYLERFNPLIAYFFKPDNKDKVFDKMFNDCTSLIFASGVDLRELDNVSVEVGNSKVSFVETFCNCIRVNIGIFKIITPRQLDLTKTFYKCKTLTYDSESERMLIATTRPVNVNLTETFYEDTSLTAIPQLLFYSGDVAHPNSITSRTLPTINLTKTFAYSGITEYKRESLPPKVIRPIREVSQEEKEDEANYSPFQIFGHNATFDSTFSHCKKLTQSVWMTFGSGKDRGSIINLTKTFEYCENLAKIDGLFVKGYTTVNMNQTYLNCENLTKLQPIFSEENTVINLIKTFENCTKLVDIDNIFAGTNGTINMNRTYLNCTNLVDVMIDLTNVKNIVSIFEGCTSLQKVTFLNATNIQRTQLESSSLNISLLGKSGLEIKFK